MYIEASSQRQGDKADLISEVLPAGREFCMQFALNMLGTDMGFRGYHYYGRFREFIKNTFTRALDTRE